MFLKSPFLKKKKKKKKGPQQFANNGRKYEGTFISMIEKCQSTLTDLSS